MKKFPTRDAMRRAACRLMVLALAASGAGVIANACSASPNDTSEAGADTGSGPGGHGAGGATASSGNGGTGNVDLDASGPSGTGGGRDACAAVGAEAKTGIQPADVIVAVDTSGSMDLEAGWTQQSLQNFADQITNSGIDVHVVLIASNDMCVPGSLGSGSCPADEKLPNYRHVVQGVDSNNGLQIILQTYPQWKDSLRPEASKTFLIVTDDESDMSAADFTNQLLALDPPTFQNFKFDAISAAKPAITDDPIGCLGSPQPCCIYAAAEGKVYETLVTQTGGILGDLCLQTFDPVFQSIATAVVMGSKVSCEVDIPPAPDGGMFDPTKVNVEYTPGGMGNPEKIGNVPGGLGDCGPAGGWYYDDAQNPTKIILCPATCTQVQGDTAAKLDVYFGCATEIQPPN